MEQTTEYKMSEAEKKEALSIIARLSNLGKPGQFEANNYRENTKLVFSENWANKMSFQDFEKQIHQWGSKTDTQTLGSEKATHEQEENSQFSFVGLYVFLAETVRVLPSDRIGNAVGAYFNFSQSIAGTTRRGLEAKGYVLTKRDDGNWDVVPPKPPTPPEQPKLSKEDVQKLFEEFLKSKGLTA